jgi:hypothetical protein
MKFNYIKNGFGIKLTLSQNLTIQKIVSEKNYFVIKIKYIKNSFGTKFTLS